ncbi:MAG: hypothetical protein ILP10_06690 [Lachnospiraceae bacterium]|nr:hypothetical protein [Lachnospiraceae bacterium]
MPDRIEDILKKIHILLAKSEVYHGSTDRVIISKRDMFRILEELNEEIDVLLDKCEATAMSRERARLDFEKQQADFIDKTRKRAEEINAASLMYTDNMLDDVKGVISSAREKIQAELNSVTERLNDLCDTIGANKKDVMEKIRELKDSERYEKLLEEEREKMSEKADAEGGEDEAESVSDKPSHVPYEIKIHDPGDTGVTMFGKKRAPKKTKEEKQKILEEMKVHEEPSDDTPPDVGGRHYNSDDFDLDREYFEFVEEKEKEAADDGSKKGKKPRKKGPLDSLFGRSKQTT